VVLALESLAGENRAAFLARLVFNLSISARACYPETEADSARSIEVLTGLNEVLHIVGSQLRSEAGGGGGYPDDETFIQAVLGQATLHGCAAEVRWSIVRASQ